jgi:hypothetical protein
MFLSNQDKPTDAEMDHIRHLEQIKKLEEEIANLRTVVMTMME